MKIKIVFAALITLCTASTVLAAAYQLPADDESLVGQRLYRSANNGDTVSTLARRYDVGRNAIENANPHLNMATAFPSGAPIQVPTQHLLPNERRHGIIINLPEMRMYYYPEDSTEVLTYPIGIGKVGKTIPIIRTAVTHKRKDPVWIPPEDIREFNLDQGIVLPKVMPSGPDNPLGPYAIYMRLPTYLIHSTPFPDSIGKRTSFGCIRMYEWDIKDFFPSIKGGIPVVIINSPTKVGWQNNQLYLEAHKPLEEHSSEYEATLPGMVHMLARASKEETTLIDWQLVSYIAEDRDGIPHQVGMQIKN